MSKKCNLTKKKPLVGNNVSHSKRRTKRTQEPNLQWKRFWHEELGRWIRLRVSTSAIRTISKLGLAKALKVFGADTQFKRRTRAEAKPSDVAPAA
ncbi:MAG: 50S ribosomal protein L28 [bacterium]|nr:50S ribosomal protein L28 [bacterium]